MKNSVKKIFAIISLILIVFSLFSVTAFAEEFADFSEETTEPFLTQIPENNKFHIILPDGYGVAGYNDDINNQNFSCVGEEGSGNNTLFYVYVLDNGLAPTGITTLTKDMATEVIENTYISDYFAEEDEMKYGEYTREKVNGYYSTKYVMTENLNSYNTVYDIEVYFFATKENIYMLLFEGFNNGTLQQDIKFILKSFVMNGTHYEGETPTVSYDFTGKPDLTEVTESTQLTDEEFAPILTAVFVVIFIIPTVILIVLIVVLSIVYVNNKKKEKELQEQVYRFIGVSGQT